MLQIQEAWNQFSAKFTAEQHVPAMSLVIYLVLAGVLAFYIRFLYRKCSASPSDTDSITRVFPLLAIVATGIIAVVKSSLALSLGLIGALSIVRFRAAIKDPEELVYLLLCIAIGLTLGAEQPLLAIAMVAIASVFIVLMHLASRGKRRERLLLTITGDAAQHFSNDESGVMSVVESIAGNFTLQRYDVENGRGQVRIVLDESNSGKTAAIISRLRERLPDCDLAYVNLNSTI